MPRAVQRPGRGVDVDRLAHGGRHPPTGPGIEDVVGPLARDPAVEDQELAQGGRKEPAFPRQGRRAVRPPLGPLAAQDRGARRQPDPVEHVLADHALDASRLLRGLGGEPVVEAPEHVALDRRPTGLPDVRLEPRERFPEARLAAGGEGGADAAGPVPLIGAQLAHLFGSSERDDGPPHLGRPDGLLEGLAVQPLGPRGTVEARHGLGLQRGDGPLGGLQPRLEGGGCMLVGWRRLSMTILASARLWTASPSRSSSRSLEMGGGMGVRPGLRDWRLRPRLCCGDQPGAGAPPIPASVMPRAASSAGRGE